MSSNFGHSEEVDVFLRRARSAVLCSGKFGHDAGHKGLPTHGELGPRLLRVRVHQRERPPVLADRDYQKPFDFPIT